jgi:drug/metabolite transporter, DME family
MPAVLAVLAAAVLFGTTGTAKALVPDGAGPLAIGAVRIALGGVLLALLALVAARRPRAAPRPRLTARPAVLIAVVGVCLAVYQPLFFLGTERNGVAVGTVVALGSAPVIAGVLEWMLTRRRPSGVWVAATVLATAGVVLLGFGGGGAGSTDALGLVGSVGAGASFAVLANAQRRLLDAGWDPLTIAGGMGLVAAVLAIAVLPFTDLSWLATPGGAGVALWLGVATIGVAYALFTWGLGRLTAASAATLTLAEPLTASILGIVLLGERLAPLAVAGLAVLAAGLVLLAWGSRRPRDPRPFAVEG